MSRFENNTPQWKPSTNTKSPVIFSQILLNPQNTHQAGSTASREIAFQRTDSPVYPIALEFGVDSPFLWNQWSRMPVEGKITDILDPFLSPRDKQVIKNQTG